MFPTPVGIFLGHLLGDFVFQNKWMAVNKHASSFKCVVHCVIYTFCVLVCTVFRFDWAIFIFVSHFLVDRWSLADKWLTLINGRSLLDFLLRGHKQIPLDEFAVIKMYNECAHIKDLDTVGQCYDTNYKILRGGFTALVYTVVDNTFHLLSMYTFYYYWIQL